MASEGGEGEGAAAGPDEGSASAGDAPPWPADFPDVVVHTTLEQLYGAALVAGESLTSVGHSPSYDAAKAGDTVAATRVVLAVIRPELVIDFASAHPDAIAVGVHAQERAGRNALPETYVAAIGQIGALAIDLTIVQTNRTWHTGASARQRLARTPTFAGIVQPGRDYIVADDVTTTGSSLSALRHFIEARGGRVRFATTLAAAKGRWGQNPLRTRYYAGNDACNLRRGSIATS